MLTCERSPSTPHFFKLVEYEVDESTDHPESKSDAKESSLDLTNRKITWFTYVQPTLVPLLNQKKRLDIKISLDKITWTELKPNYEAFEQKVTEKVEALLSKKENYASIPFEWLGNFKIIAATKIVQGCGILSMFGGLEEPWKNQTWKIFDKISDRFWNSHYVNISCYMQDSEQAASLSIIYTDDLEKRTKHIEDHTQNYQTLLESALSSLEILKSGENCPLGYPKKISWKSGLADFFVHRQIAEELHKQNADLIRIHERMCVSKNYQPKNTNID